jgi:hypothetical protein
VEQENRQAAAKAEQERQQAEADRKSAEFEAYLKTRPPASSEMIFHFNRWITSDSRAWLMNRYDEGSLRDVVILEERPDGRMTLRGNYTFNNGLGGWVQGQFINRRVQCLQYWDTGSCAPVRISDEEDRFSQAIAIYLKMKHDSLDILKILSRCPLQFEKDPKFGPEGWRIVDLIEGFTANFFRKEITLQEAREKFDEYHKLTRDYLNEHNSCRE